MSKKNLMKLLLFIFLFIALRVIIVSALNGLNLSVSHYYKVTNNTINVDVLEDYLFKIENIKIKKDNSEIVNIKSEKNKEVSIVINNMIFPHQIYINDEIISQNIDKKTLNYSGRYAYKTLNINEQDYKEGQVKIEIKGENVDYSSLFIANPVTMEDSKEIRIVIYTILLLFLFILTLISIILYINDTNAKYFIIVFLIGIVSIIKSINLGELFVIAKLFNISVDSYTFTENLTSLINSILPAVLMVYLFDIKIKYKITSVLVVFTGVLISLSMCFSLTMVMRLSILYMMVNIPIITWAYVKEKPFSTIILVNNVIYSSFAMVKFVMNDHIYKNGNIDFFINTAYLGVIIYLNVFLGLFIIKYFRKMRDLKTKSEEYKKILLIRGIGHDLKLPLSVIKINNQMLDKYNMVSEENKEYVKTSLCAVHELEKMTDNINVYLSLGNINKKNDTTSIYESFMTLKEYYKTYAKDINCKLIIVCDEIDYTIEIKTIQFHRMLYNLVDNAIKYNKEGGEVIVSYKIDKEIRISIEDTGIGMDKEQINKIFTPFYRIDDSRTREGLGLGLSVVKGVVDNLKGQIKVESEKDTGTKITIVLPK